MPRFALIQDNQVVNFIAAEPGWKHPDGELVPDHELTEGWAEKQGIRFARNGEDILDAYSKRETIVLGGVREHEVYQLLNNELPEGCFIAGSTGTTGERKLSCTSWAKIEKRAQAFLEMAGSDFAGPVWFPDAFSVTAFSSTGRMACLLNGISSTFGREIPKVEPRVVAGTPSAILRMLENVPKESTVITTGAPTPDNFREKIGDRKFIDFYSSTDGGSISMVKYDGDNFEIMFPSSGRMVTTPDGSIELPLDQVADKYLTHPVPLRNGRFVTGDKVVDGKIRRNQ